MSDLLEAEKREHLDELRRRMKQAKEQFENAYATAADLKRRWDAYAELETDPARLQATAADYSARIRGFIDDPKCGKAPMAMLLDLLAHRIVDSEGEPLTRQDLLNELAAVQVPQQQ